MGKRNLTTMIAIVSMTLTMGFFTNCSQGEHVSEGSSVGGLSNKDFFDYGYTAKPDFFGELSLLKPKAQLSNLAQFKIVGNVAFIANANTAISYTVKIRAPNGAALCPTQTGTIAAKSTYFEVDCVSSVQAKTALAEFTVSASGKTFTFKREYAD